MENTRSHYQFKLSALAAGASPVMTPPRSHYPDRPTWPTCGRISLRPALAMMAGLWVLAGFRAEGAIDLFVSGTGGFDTFRIPALYETTDGTLLAFCEGRVSSSSDTGNINVVLRRSLDGGVTWAAGGKLVFSGANTYSGQTGIQAGTLVAANHSALGAGGHATGTMTHIYSGATLADRSWSAAGVVMHVVLNDNGTTQLVRAAVEIGNENRRFLRLKVTLP